MIEEYARVLARVAGLHKSGLDDDARRELREAYRTWFALEAAEIDSLSPEELLEKIRNHEDFPPPKIEALAKGLTLEADLLSPSDPQTADRRQKALILFQHLEEVDKGTFSWPRKNAIAELKRLLGIGS